MSTQRYAGRTALVTGASGFIGTALCARLQSVGAKVHGISRRHLPSGAQGMQWWQSDLVDAGDVRRIVEAVRPDFIFHLASHVAGSRALELVLPTLQGNFLAAVNVLSAATQVGCERLVLTGSMDEPQPDGNWPIPCSPYAAAKFAASAYGRMFHSLYRTPVVMLRLFMVYGPAQQDLKKLVPYVTLSLLDGHAPQLSSGVRRVDWIYIDDVVDGYVAAALSPAVDGSTIDLGSGELESVRSIVERLTAIVGTPGVVPVFGAVSDRPMEQERSANLALARTALGWGPRTELDDGLRRTVDWYRAWRGASGTEGEYPVQPKGAA
jgi:nucleoside-diphosphate-sugar epimerase